MIPSWISTHRDLPLCKISYEIQRLRPSNSCYKFRQKFVLQRKRLDRTEASPNSPLKYEFQPRKLHKLDQKCTQGLHESISMKREHDGSDTNERNEDMSQSYHSGSLGIYRSLFHVVHHLNLLCPRSYATVFKH